MGAVWRLRPVAARVALITGRDWDDGFLPWQLFPRCGTNSVMTNQSTIDRVRGEVAKPNETTVADILIRSRAKRAAKPAADANKLYS